MTGRVDALRKPPTSRHRGDSVSSVTSFFEGEKGPQKKWKPQELAQIILQAYDAYKKKGDSSFDIGSFLQRIERGLKLVRQEKKIALNERVDAIAHHILSIEAHAHSNGVRDDSLKEMQKVVTPILEELLGNLQGDFPGKSLHLELAYLKLTLEKNPHQLDEVLNYLKRTSRKFDYPSSEASEDEKIKQIQSALFLGNGSERLNYPLYESVRRIAEGSSSQQIAQSMGQMIGGLEHGLRMSMSEAARLLMREGYDQKINLSAHSLEEHFVLLGVLLQLPDRAQVLVNFLQNPSVKQDFDTLRLLLQQPGCEEDITSIEHLISLENFGQDPFRISRAPDWAKAILKKHLVTEEPTTTSGKKLEVKSRLDALEKHFQVLAAILRLPNRIDTLHRYAKYLHSQLLQDPSASAFIKTFQLDSAPVWAHPVLAECGFFVDVTRIDMQTGKANCTKSAGSDIPSAVVINGPKQEVSVFDGKAFANLSVAAAFYKGLSACWKECGSLFNGARFLQLEFSKKEGGLERSLRDLKAPECRSLVLKPEGSSDASANSSQGIYVKGESLVGMVRGCPSLECLHLEGLFLNPQSLAQVAEVLSDKGCELRELRLGLAFPLGDEKAFKAAIEVFTNALRHSKVSRIYLELEFPPYQEVVPEPDDLASDRWKQKKVKKVEAKYEKTYEAIETAYEKRVQIAKGCITALLKGLRDQSCAKTIKAPQWPLDLLPDLLKGGADITLLCDRFFPGKPVITQAFFHPTVAFRLGILGLKTPETADGTIEIFRGLFAGSFDLNTISQMRVLDLSHTGLRREGLKELRSLLELVQSLNALDLSGNSLGPEDLVHILAIMDPRFSNRLMYLNLTGNDLSGQKGAPAPPLRRFKDSGHAPPLPPRNIPRRSDRWSTFLGELPAGSGASGGQQPMYEDPEAALRAAGLVLDEDRIYLDPRVAEGQQPLYDEPADSLAHPVYVDLDSTPDNLYGDGSGLTVEQSLAARAKALEEEDSFGFGDAAEGGGSAESAYDVPILPEEDPQYLTRAQMEEGSFGFGDAEEPEYDVPILPEEDAQYLTLAEAEAEKGAAEELYACAPPEDDVSRVDSEQAARLAFVAGNQGVQPLPPDAKIVFRKEIIPRACAATLPDLEDIQSVHPIEKILEAAVKCSSLISLRLAGCGWTQGVLEACKVLLPQIKTLRVLSIGDRTTSLDEAKALMKILEPTGVEHLEMPHQLPNVQEEIYMWNVQRCRHALRGGTLEEASEA